MVTALSRGLTLLDFETLTFGMIVDFIIEHDNMNIDHDDPNIVREATQEDFKQF